MPNMRSTREKSSSLYKTDVLFDILEKKSIIRSGWITFTLYGWSSRAILSNLLLFHVSDSIA